MIIKNTCFHKKKNENSIILLSRIIQFTQKMSTKYQIKFEQNQIFDKLSIIFCTVNFQFLNSR